MLKIIQKRKISSPVSLGEGGKQSRSHDIERDLAPGPDGKGFRPLMKKHGKPVGTGEPAEGSFPDQFRFPVNGVKNQNVVREKRKIKRKRITVPEPETRALNRQLGIGQKTRRTVLVIQSRPLCLQKRKLAFQARRKRKSLFRRPVQQIYGFRPAECKMKGKTARTTPPQPMNVTRDFRRGNEKTS